MKCKCWRRSRALGGALIMTVNGVETQFSSADLRTEFQSFTGTFSAPCSCSELAFSMTGGDQDTVYLDAVIIVECATCPLVPLSELPAAICPSDVDSCTVAPSKIPPRSRSDFESANPADPSPQPLPANGLRINFQPPDMRPIPSGYVADSGAPFGRRASGFRYGWSCDLQSLGDYRDRNNAHTRYSSLVIPDRTSVCDSEMWGIGVYVLTHYRSMLCPQMQIRHF